MNTFFCSRNTGWHCSLFSLILSLSNISLSGVELRFTAAGLTDPTALGCPQAEGPGMSEEILWPEVCYNNGTIEKNTTQVSCTLGLTLSYSLQVYPSSTTYILAQLTVLPCMQLSNAGGTMCACTWGCFPQVTQLRFPIQRTKSSQSRPRNGIQ